MALYQPTNVIPSSYTKGTVDVKDNMEISWQVNGNSAMKYFQIDFYSNNLESTFIKSTGNVYVERGGFYGTDRFGNPQFYTYKPTDKVGNPIKWKDFSELLTNGNEYKYKISQWYEGDSRLMGYTITSALSSNKKYYFALDGGGYISFTSNRTFPANTSQFYYRVFDNRGFCIIGSGENIKHIPITFIFSQSIPDDAEYVGLMVQTGEVGPSDVLVSPYSFNAFITRSKPTLNLYQCSDKTYSDSIDFPNGGTIATSIGYFHADYQQEQGDPIRWVRWQVATANNGNVGEILADTGDIYTPTLNYEYNGFFNKTQYAIRCFGESERGQSCDTGWIIFNINIENPGQYTGICTARCLNKENAALIEWEGVEVIPATVSPENYTPNISNSKIMLDKNTSVEWETKEIGNKVENMSFEPPWTAVWKGEIGSSRIDRVSLTINPTEPVNLGRYYDFLIRGSTDTSLSDFEGGRYYLYTDLQITSRHVLSATIFNKSSNIAHSSVTFAPIDNNMHIVAILCSYTANASVSATVRVYYTNEFTGSTQYTMPGRISDCEVVSYSSNATQKPNCLVNGNTLTVVGNAKAEKLAAVQPISVEVDVTYWNVGENSSPSGKLFSIGQQQYNDISLTKTGGTLSIAGNGLEEINWQIPNNSALVTVALTPTTLYAIFYLKWGAKNGETVALSANYTQQPITAISIFGGEDGATINSVSVYKGDGSNILPLYENSYAFEPTWNNNDYSLYMSANFNSNLDGGTGTVSGEGFRVYRQEIGKNILTPIATVPSTVTSVKDYGIVSRKAYKYSLYAYDINSAFMSAVEAENIIATCFKNYSLLVCDYDETLDEYHVRKQYLFALNLSVGSVGNNNSPTLNANFTRYPTRMPSTQNYASGTLQGLIGAIYTVPALIEQIGNYKWTAKPSTMDYFDSVDLEQELYDLSTAPYQLFLRDMKGRLRMIHTSASITMTTNIKQKQQSISISFPWVEIGDASDVTIIQTPKDEGWNNDNQVLDVSLDVDVNTGELSATYPYPYNGTKFYLTGVNKETLTAKTPLGIMPAQFELSEVAEEPNDGELTATVKVDSEDN